MPGADWIPLVSQLKSTIQALTGDEEGALRTQENFIRECPIVSQTVAAVEYASGRTESARETWNRGIGTISDVADSVPLVGHVKGGIHHLVGDHEGGDRALKAATRTSVVMGTGAVAAVTTGGIAAIPAGMAAGAAFDTVDSVANDKPKGLFAVVDNAVQNPSGGSIFDATAAFVGDGLAGYSGGQIGVKVANKVQVARLESQLNTKMNQLNAAFDPKSSMTSGEAVSLGNEIKALGSKIETIQNGGTPVYVDKVKGQTGSSTAISSSTVPPPPLPTTTNEEEEQIQEKKKPTPKPNPGKIEVPTPPRSPKTWLESAIVEEAFHADYYGEECNGGTEEKKAQAQAYKEQETSNKKLTECSGKTSWKTNTVDEVEKIGGDQDRDPQRVKIERTCQLVVQVWLLLVRMPKCFNYTGAAVMNNTREGLLHTFIRHHDQWSRFIDTQDILPQLQPILDLMRQVCQAKSKGTAKYLMIKLEQLIANLPDSIWSQVQHALFDVQIRLYRFLVENITQQRYLGEGINNNGQLQVYFDVGNDMVMAVAVSCSNPNQPDFPSDPRPTRSIVTIFFISRAKFERMKTTKLF